MKKLEFEFFDRDCLEVAPDLVGKILVHTLPSGEVLSLRITQTEAYRGEEDTACHAHRGRTKKTEPLYAKSGTVYVYLCYGMHWLVNVITGGIDNPQGVLIRACEGYEGPAKLTKYLKIDKEQNMQSFVDGELSIFDDGKRYEIKTDKRVGINYADKADVDKEWRYILAMHN